MNNESRNKCNCQNHSRRDFLKLSAAATAGLILPSQSIAQSNIQELQGNVFVNKRVANLSTPIMPGDLVTVAHGGKLSFVMNEDAYLLRGGSSLQLESNDNVVVNALRLLTGGILAVFGKSEKTVHTRTSTIGIRGTGIYLDTTPEKTYFCTCYGETELNVQGGGNDILRAEHHESAWIYTPASGSNNFERMGMFMGDYPLHTDDHLRALEAMVGRKVPFDT